MAAIYDALGNVIGDDGQPSIDQMQYELSKNGKPSPLDTAVNAIKNVAVNYNPLMLRKQGLDLAGDIPRVVASGVAPYIAGITQPLVGAYNYASKMPGVLYREKVLGDPQSMQEAATIREGLPQFGAPGARYNPEPMNQRVQAIGQAVAPQTPQGQAVLEGLGQVFQAAKLPTIGPGSGVPGTSRVSPRPLITPNDLRVVGAEATRVGRQVVDIPTDFVNAQSGFQRIDPVTGQPVMGARIQSGVDRLGDIMEQRKMQGLTPIPGLPAVFQPETNMYTIRPSEGPNYVVNPKLPESALAQRPDLDTAGIYSAINDLRPIKNPTINNVNGAYYAANIVDNPTADQAYTAYYDNVLRTLFPDTQNIAEANVAYELTYPREEERSKVNRTILNNFINEFNQTAEPDAQLPTMEQFAENVKAADKWLDNTFTKQLVKNVGTTNDPLLKQAEQGITFKDPVQLVAEYSMPSAKLQNARQAAGFNPSGEYFDAMNAAKQELDRVTNDEYLPLERQRIQAQQDAARLGIPVTDYEPYRNLTAPRDRASAKVEKLEEAYKKLQIANAYSNAVDSMVTTKTAKQAWDKIPRAERQFYPQLRDLAANAPDTPIYDVFAKHSASGYQEMGQDIVKQIVTGKIKAKDLHKTPLDVMVKKKAEARDAVEKAAQTEIKQRVQAVSTKLIEDLALVPEVFRFSNASVLEISNKYDVDTIRRMLSADTDVLDLCAANSGKPPKSAKSIYHPNKASEQGYYPSADPITGARLRNVGDTSYVKDTAKGTEFNASIRDNVTGLPVGLLQFSSLGPNRAGVTEYSMGFVSGFKNHEPIEPQYRNVVRDYLNLRADIIKSSNSEKLATNGIYDTSKPTQQLLNNLNLSRKQWDEASKAYAGTIPRFITPEDGRNILQAVRDQQRAAAPATQTPSEVGDMQTQRTALLEEQRQLQNEQRREPTNDVTQRLDDIASQLQDIDQRLARSTQQQQPQGVEQRLSDLREVINVPMHRENDPQVEAALNVYAMYLQDRIDAQTQAGYLPEQIADYIRTDINQLRNDTFNNPNDYTLGFGARQVDDFVGALRTTIDTIGQWLEEQRRQQAPEPDVQEQRLTANQQITNAYRNEFSLITEEPDVDDFLIEFQNQIDAEVNRLFGEGRTHNDIAMYVADTIVERIRELLTDADTGLTLNRYALNNTESNIARGRLNTAFASVTDIDEGLDEPDPTNAPEDYENIYFGPVETRPATTPAQALPPPVQTRAQRNPDANIDSFINRVRREEGAQIADRVETVAYRVAENVTNSRVNQLDADQAEEFARGLRVAAELEDSELVEIALRGLADMVTTLVAQDPEAAFAQPAIPPPVAQAPAADELGPRLNTIREDIVNRDNAAGFIVDEIFGAHAQAGTRDQILTAIADELDGRINFIRNMPLGELEEYGIDGARMRDVYTVPALSQALHSVRILQNETQQPDVVDYDRMMGRFDSIQNAARRRNDNLSELIDEVWNDSVDRLTEHAVGIPSQNLRDMITRMIDDLDERHMFYAGLDRAVWDEHDIDSQEDWVDLRNGINTVVRRLRGMREEMAPVQLEQQQAFTPQDALDMAREILDEERVDQGQLNVPSIQDSIYALRNGTFDDARIRRLPEQLRQPFAESVSNALETLLAQEAPQRMQAAQNLIADTAVARQAIGYAVVNIENDYGQDVANRAFAIIENIAEHLDPGDQLTAFVMNIRRRMQDAGLGQDMYEALDHIADELASVGREAPRQRQVQPVLPAPATAPYTPIPANIAAMSDQAITADMTFLERNRVQNMFETLTDVNMPGELQNIVSLARSYAMGFWENFSDVQREWLARNIEEYIRDNPPPNTPPPEGHKDGGRIRKYQDDGSVHMEKGGRPPPSGREMYMPKELTTLEKASRFVDDNVAPFVNRGVDAMFPMREMVRIALLSKTQAPLQKLRQQDPHAFDYAMDQASNGNMYPLPKQDEMIPVGKANGGQVNMHTFAKGGTVHTIPSVEQMQYELMMRRK